MTSDFPKLAFTPRPAHAQEAHSWFWLPIVPFLFCFFVAQSLLAEVRTGGGVGSATYASQLSLGSWRCDGSTVFFFWRVAAEGFEETEGDTKKYKAVKYILYVYKGSKRRPPYDGINGAIWPYQSSSIWFPSKTAKYFRWQLYQSIWIFK